jgi:hypothetical protein
MMLDAASTLSLSARFDFQLVRFVSSRWQAISAYAA